MPYSPTTWVDNTTPANAANMNKLEQGVADAIPKDVFDAKGEIVAATGADAFARVPAATANGMVLTSDTAQATGVKFAAPTGVTMGMLIALG